MLLAKKYMRKAGRWHGGPAPAGKTGSDQRAGRTWKANVSGSAMVAALKHSSLGERESEVVSYCAGRGMTGRAVSRALYRTRPAVHSRADTSRSAGCPAPHFPLKCPNPMSQMTFLSRQGRGQQVLSRSPIPVKESLQRLLLLFSAGHKYATQRAEACTLLM